MLGYGCAPGLAFDLTTVDTDDGQPWDLSRPDRRAKAERMLDEQKPDVLIGSPFCSRFRRGNTSATSSAQRR